MEKESTSNASRSKEEVALELMKFIALTTSFGKTSTAGFAGKPLKSPEEQVEALLQLYEKCRSAVARS
jgi:UDP-N-acetylmuramyl pentapeptide synthase